MSRSDKSAEDLAVAEAVEIESLPIIDFAPFRFGDNSERVSVASEIAAACRNIGFFYLIGHGLPDELVDDMFAQSQAFYSLPEPERQSARSSRDNFLGWAPPRKTDALSRDTRLFHQYLVQLPARTGAQDTRPALDNRWPTTLDSFRPVAELYMGEMHRLSLDLLRAFAIGLDLPETRFVSAFQSPPSLLNLLYQPPLPTDASLDVSNMVSHTDEGPITILAQGAVGGLEVRRRDGKWIQAPPHRGAFTINVGDVMMWWTNGEYFSNYHRVRNRSGQERFSIPYFCYPDHHVTISPLPELAGTDAAYPDVSIGDLLERFHQRQNDHMGM